MPIMCALVRSRDLGEFEGPLNANATLPLAHVACRRGGTGRTLRPWSRCSSTSCRAWRTTGTPALACQLNFHQRAETTLLLAVMVGPSFCCSHPCVADVVTADTCKLVPLCNKGYTPDLQGCSVSGRTMYQRMQALLKDGTLADQSLNGSAGAGRADGLGGAGSTGLISDMDAFSQKLANIVTSDYTHAALVRNSGFYRWFRRYICGWFRRFWQKDRLTLWHVLRSSLGAVAPCYHSLHTSCALPGSRLPHACSLTSFCVNIQHHRSGSIDSSSSDAVC